MTLALAALLLHIPSLTQQLSFRAFLASDGLPSEHVTALMQDSRGYLWVGTDNGIALYDGMSFRTLGTTEGLENPYVVCLLESRIRPGVCG